ncbi:Six-hairpin glycosidase-like protein [Neofusicoccum parvum]|nr:Six-hairpin glycosidase-like protein [Neofusicoccum parvum]
METTHLLYGATGCAHNEMNVIGHTGTKSDAGRANHPASAAWQVQHVGDPLTRNTAEFWLSQLQPDEHPSTTGTLVANPCNSPDTAFARTASSSPTNSSPPSSTPAPTRGIEASTALPDRRHDAPLSTGPHLTAQGTAAEWKSAGLDVRGDAHRPAHLSHLLGWYPGYYLAAGFPLTRHPLLPCFPRW